MRITKLLNTLRQDAGMTTAEYAVGTMAAAGLGGLLIKIVTSSEMKALIFGILEKAFSALFG